MKNSRFLQKAFVFFSHRFVRCILVNLTFISLIMSQEMNVFVPDPLIPHLSLSQSYINSFEDIIVIGDVHGCYDELRLLLQHNNITDTTLKIFTGDLVNKGPQSKAVLDFIKTSNSSLSVRGNCDTIAIEEYLKWKESISSSNRVPTKEDINDDFEKTTTFKPHTPHAVGQTPVYKLPKVYRFVKDLNVEDIIFLKDLPYSIRLDPLSSIIVHAGFDPNVSIEDSTPFTLMNIKGIFVNGTLDTKSQKSSPWASHWEGPERVYFGHDSRKRLQRYPFATGLDTACVFGGYLTGTFLNGPRKRTFIQEPATKKYS